MPKQYSADIMATGALSQAFGDVFRNLLNAEQRVPDTQLKYQQMADMMQHRALQAARLPLLEQRETARAAAVDKQNELLPFQQQHLDAQTQNLLAQAGNAPLMRERQLAEADSARATRSWRDNQIRLANEKEAAQKALREQIGALGPITRENLPMLLGLLAQHDPSSIGSTVNTMMKPEPAEKQMRAPTMLELRGIPESERTPEINLLIKSAEEKERLDAEYRRAQIAHEQASTLERRSAAAKLDKMVTEGKLDAVSANTKANIVAGLTKSAGSIGDENFRGIFGKDFSGLSKDVRIIDEVRSYFRKQALNRLFSENGLDDLIAPIRPLSPEAKQSLDNFKPAGIKEDFDWTQLAPWNWLGGNRKAIPQPQQQNDNNEQTGLPPGWSLKLK